MDLVHVFSVGSCLHALAFYVWYLGYTYFKAFKVHTYICRLHKRVCVFVSFCRDAFPFALSCPIFVVMPSRIQSALLCSKRVVFTNIPN